MRWLRWWFARKGSFFGTESSADLCLFRFLYCALMALEVMGSAAFREGVFTRPRYDPIPLFSFIAEPLSLGQFEIVRAVLVIALIASALGVWTRPALWLSAITFFLYEGTYLGFTKPRDSEYVYHMSNLSWFVLVVLGLSRGIAAHTVINLKQFRERVQPVPEWPRRTIVALLCIAYFGAGYCKMVESPLWVDGYTLQAYFLDRGIRHDMELPLQLAANHELCVVLSVATVALELTFFVVLFFPRLAWIYVASGLMLHLSILFTMSINFFQYFAFNYLAFVSVAPFLRAKRGMPAAPSVPPPEPRRAAWPGIVLVTVAVVCVLRHIESWPFSDFRVYSKRRHPDQVAQLFVSKPNEEGEQQLLPIHVQHRFQRAIGFRVASEALAAHRAAPEERERALSAAKASIYRRVMESDPKFFRRHKGLRLCVKRPLWNEEDGRYRIVSEPITELPPPT